MQCLTFRHRQIVLDEDMAMLEQIHDFLLQPLATAGDAAGGHRGGAKLPGRL